MKRPLIAVAVAFIAGVLAFVCELNIPLVLACAAAVTVWALFFGRSRKYLLFAVVIAMLLGILRAYAADCREADVLQRFKSREAVMTMTVTEFSDDGKAVAEFSEEGKTYKIYLIVKSGRELAPGDIVRAGVSPAKPYSSKVSISDFSTYLASRNVYMCASVSDVQIIGRHKSGIRGAVYSVRRYIDKIGENAFSGDARALFNAMVLGDKRLMSEELSASLRASGLNHIAVVSGMHLSIMISVIMMLLGRLTGNTRGGRLILSLGAVFLTLVTGAGASVVRACIMCIICQGAYFFYRESDALSSLFLTVLLMVGFNPYMIFNIGFILSVLSVLGIMLYSDRVGEKVSKYIGGTVGEAIAVCISAQLTVVPAVIYFFGTVSVYSVLANVGVTVFATLIVTCGMLFVAVAKIPLISGVTAFLVKLFCEAVTVVCNFIRTLPGALTEVKGLNIYLLLIWLFALVLLGVRRKSRAFTVRASACFAAAMLTVLLFSVCGGHKVKMNFVSYGAASMTAIFCDDDASVLVGCPDSSDAVCLAEAYHKSSYTYTVIAENVNCEAEDLAANGMSGTVIACAEMFSDEEKAAFADELEQCGAEVVFLKNGESFYGADMSVRFNVMKLSGEACAAPEIEYKGHSIVFLQDFDTNRLEELVRDGTCFYCDYLKLPPSLPGDADTYEALCTGRLLTDEKTFAINLY